MGPRCNAFYTVKNPPDKCMHPPHLSTYRMTYLQHMGTSLLFYLSHFVIHLFVMLWRVKVSWYDFIWVICLADCGYKTGEYEMGVERVETKCEISIS